jgi:hypothetical protein
MSSQKVSFKEWVDMLSPYYKRDSIRRYYFKEKGDYKALVNRYSSKVLEKGAGIKKKIEQRKVLRLVSVLDTRFKYPYPSYKRKNRHDKKGVITLDLAEIHFDKFFGNINIHFEAKPINNLMFSQLEIILKEYYDEYRQIKRLKKLINKDSIREEEKAINTILDKAKEILQIIDNDIYKSIPSNIQIKSINQLDSETISKLKELNLKAHSYAELLSKLRQI